jgi:hypothetical protein
VRAYYAVSGKRKRLLGGVLKGDLGIVLCQRRQFALSGILYYKLKEMLRPSGGASVEQQQRNDDCDGYRTEHADAIRE